MNLIFVFNFFWLRICNSKTFRQQNFYKVKNMINYILLNQNYLVILRELNCLITTTNQDCGQLWTVWSSHEGCKLVP